MKATIKDAKICDVLDVWKRKPRQLAFNDTDVVIVTVKAGNKVIKETFFTCVKPDGTFNLKTPSKLSRLRRKRLADFIKYYFKVKDIEEYDLRKNISSWKGKEVEIDKKEFIIIP